MSMSLHLDFNPYADWLQVRETARPLNAYQLLNLKPLEQDRERIRGAILRQQSLLEARESDADPTLWQQIHKELEAAILTLQEPDRKILLDAALKRQLKPLAVGSAPRSEGGAAISCRECNTENSSNRRFCGDCGAPLFEACPQCAAEVAASEKFCGSCGTNLRDRRRKQETELENELEQAEQLQRTHRFEQAAQRLRKVAVVEDPQLERFAAEAVSRLEQYAQQRRTLEEKAQRRLEKSRQLLDSYAYESAFEKLDGIPEGLRTKEIREALEEARYKKNELLTLGGEIRDAIAQNRKFELLPKIERLLALKPDHAQAREMAEQLRDQLCHVAKKKLAAHSYDEARTMLESIPNFIRNTDVEALVERTMELAALATDVRLSPVADDTLVALAEKLVKLSPQDATAAKQLAEMKQRRATPPSERRLAYSPWGTIPRRTLLGLPIELLGHVTRCDFASPETEAALRAHPGEFFVAFGLALQGRQQAAVALDLLPPPERSGFLGVSFSLTRKKSQPKGAWGLDLGPTGLKAIRLAADPNGDRVRITDVVHLPHARPLNQAGDEASMSDLVTATLQRFRELHPPNKDKNARDSYMAALPGARTLGRFFDLPPVAAKKLPELVQYEAKHQVPIPLEELNWAYEVLEQVEGKAADENARHVLLVAAKHFHVKDRLTLFERAELPLDGLAAEPLALHNAVRYELGEELGTRKVAVMDIGSQGSNFVVTGANRVWFRTSGNGSDDFTSALVKQCQFTQAQAEEIKRTPQRAPRFYRSHEALQPQFVQMSSEVERSLSSVAKLFPERTPSQDSLSNAPGRSVDKLYLVGAGATTHGLLRYLIHGR